MDRQSLIGTSQTLDMRSDLHSMLMPFFPEEIGLRRYRTTLGNHTITISSDDPENTIATPADRKILNLLAGAIAYNIRAGGEPSRHIAIDTRTMVEALADDSSVGGSQYARITTRLKRLMATVIETEMPLGDDISRRRRFRWIDAFEHDDKDLPGGRRMLGLRITISEDAFLWMTRTLGYDISRTRFHSLTSSRSSIWRIYEICLARLLANQGADVCIPIDYIRTRIPIGSPLKAFKSRTLRGAMDAIAIHPEMSQHILLSLVSQTGPGLFDDMEFSQRSRLDSLHVRVRKGITPLPPLNRILAQSDHKSVARPSPAGSISMKI